MDSAPPEYAAELRRRRAQASLSLAQLAALAHVDRAYLHRVETGQRWPSRTVAKLIDDALSAHGVLLTAWQAGAAERAASAEHGRLLAASARSSAAIDELLADNAPHNGDDALALADQLGRAYLTTPPAPMLRETLAARQQAVTLLHGTHRVGLRRDLTRAVGYQSGVLAYAALDLGDPATAHRHANTAWRCADTVGDGTLRAWVRGTQSLIARFQQDYATAAELAVDGLDYVSAWHGTATARLLAGEAQSLANLGDRAGTHRALTAAETACDQSGVDELGGLFTFSPAKLSYYGGSALIWLPEPADVRRALYCATEAIELWEHGPAVDRSEDDEALAYVYAATASVRLGEPAAAAGWLGPVLALPTERRISWLRKRVGRVGTLLADRRFAGSTTTDETRNAIADFVS
ncbi:MAG: helix-turn-helix domain-containing protein [Sciscionella sp.]